MELENLIGLEKDKACKVLTEFGYNDIKIIVNSRKNELTDSLVVCAVRKEGSKIVLVCGEFYLNIER